MTISYAGNFFRLLFRWRGSVWRAIYKELILYLVIYFLISVLYRKILNDPQREVFETVALQFHAYLGYIPIEFLLGFYISTVVSRWWEQFSLICWPEQLMSLVNFIFHENDETTRLTRHQIARYFCLTCVLAWRDVSVKVRSRFPTMRCVVASGLMTDEELELYESIEAVTVRWSLPLQWIQKMFRRRFEEGKMPAPMCGTVITELNGYRENFRKLYCYDWVCVPLVYTQVTALATYGYFGFCLLGRQFLDPKRHSNHVDFFIPVFTILQFLFYVGWFKVGQELFRPFGTDDDDIELNYILDRHVRSAFSLVHMAQLQEPPLVKDRFWSTPENPKLGRSKLSAKLHDHLPKQHAYVKMKHEDDDEILEDDTLDKNLNNHNKRHIPFAHKKEKRMF